MERALEERLVVAFERMALATEASAINSARHVKIAEMNLALQGQMAQTSAMLEKMLMSTNDSDN